MASKTRKWTGNLWWAIVFNFSHYHSNDERERERVQSDEKRQATRGARASLSGCVGTWKRSMQSDAILYQQVCNSKCSMATGCWIEQLCNLLYCSIKLFYQTLARVAHSNSNSAAWPATWGALRFCPIVSLGGHSGVHWHKLAALMKSCHLHLCATPTTMIFCQLSVLFLLHSLADNCEPTCRLVCLSAFWEGQVSSGEKLRQNKIESAKCGSKLMEKNDEWTQAGFLYCCCWSLNECK